MVVWLFGCTVVGLGLACGLVLRLGLVSGLYKWLFYLATVRQLNHVVDFERSGYGVVLKNFRPRKFFRLRDFTVCIIRCMYRAELILGR